MLRSLAVAFVMLGFAAACSQERAAPGASAGMDSTQSPPTTPDEILRAELASALGRERQAANWDATDRAPYRGQLDPLGTIAPSAVSARRPKPPQVRMSASTVRGRLPPEVVQRIVRQNFGRFRTCYERALETDPELSGRVTVRFIIGRDGSVANISADGDIADAAMRACIKKGFASLSFPEPEGGIVTVSYPILFSPPDAPPAASDASSAAADSSSPSTTASEARSASAPESASALVSPTPAPAAALLPAAAPDTDPPAPIVVVEGTAVRVDGKPAGTTPAGGQDGARVQPLDDLLAQLLDVRTRYASAHPEAPFPGVCGLRIPADLPLVGLRSVFQTLALAGYSTALVQPAWSPEVVTALAVQPPTPSGDGEQAQPYPAILHVRVKGNELTLAWAHGPLATGNSNVSATAPDLGPTLCAEWQRLGSHKDPSDARRDELVLHPADTGSFSALLPVIAAAKTCTRPGPTGAMPAFLFVFSIR